MTPILFAYVVLFTLLIAGAAAAIEWALQGRVGARHVWTAAIILGAVAPASEGADDSSRSLSNRSMDIGS